MPYHAYVVTVQQDLGQLRGIPCVITAIWYLGVSATSITAVRTYDGFLTTLSRPPTQCLSTAVSPSLSFALKKESPVAITLTDVIIETKKCAAELCR